MVCAVQQSSLAAQQAHTAATSSMHNDRRRPLCGVSPACHTQKDVPEPCALSLLRRSESMLPAFVAAVCCGSYPRLVHGMLKAISQCTLQPGACAEAVPRSSHSLPAALAAHYAVRLLLCSVGQNCKTSHEDELWEMPPRPPKPTSAACAHTITAEPNCTLHTVCLANAPACQPTQKQAKLSQHRGTLE